MFRQKVNIFTTKVLIYLCESLDIYQVFSVNIYEEDSSLQRGRKTSEKHGDEIN